ncbi:hypothetical protein JW921_03035 [Candidatus Fermentibacterales bacterium]|nr:hypothetical protein [Candidatus Fermentibacterales bacterium]
MSRATDRTNTLPKTDSEAHQAAARRPFPWPAPVLILLIALGYLFRSFFASSVLPPPARMQGETTQAYRYAMLVGQGRAIPDPDTMVMHPDGADPFQNSIFEEYVAGLLYRMLPEGVDFDSYLRSFCLLFPLLVLPGLYLWMREAGFGHPQSLAAAACYAVLLPALLRARGESLYRETVAIPLLVGALAAIEGVLRGRRAAPRLLAAAVLLAASLACWKVSQYFALLLFAYLTARNLFGKPRPPAALTVVLSSVFWVCAAAIPHMRHDAALIGPASAAALCATASTRLHGRWLVVPSLLIVASTAFLTGSGSSGHVSAVLLAKLRFLFTHPGDPLRLSSDARLFWVSGYTSPSIAHLALLFGPVLLLAAPGLWKLHSRDACRLSLIPSFLVAAAIGYLLFDRLHVLLAIAICPLLAMSAGRRKALLAALPVVLVLHSVGVRQVAGFLGGIGLGTPSRSSLLTDRELDSVITWLRRETAPDEAVLCYWHLSGLVSAYAERPVVTHTFFENEANRRNIQRFAGLMFGSEDSLAAFCAEKRCSLVVHQADFLLDLSPEGLLYLAGRSGAAPAGCVAHAMQYHPEALEQFRLLYEGSSLRIYGLGDGRYRAYTGPAHLLFRHDVAGILPAYGQGLPAVVNEPLPTAVGMAMDGRQTGNYTLLSASLTLLASEGGSEDDCTGVLQEILGLYLAAVPGAPGIDRLASDFETYLAAFGPDPMLRRDLAWLLADAGRLDEAIWQYRKVLEEAPDYEQARRELQALLEEPEGAGSREESSDG